CNHSFVSKPCSAIYIGRKTGNANCAVVLMTRTIPPINTFGSFLTIVNPLLSSCILEPLEAFVSNLSRFKTNAKNAPTNTHKIELHKVFSYPQRSSAQLE